MHVRAETHAISKIAVQSIVFITMPVFVNTAPHEITLRLMDGERLTVPKCSDDEIFKLFRGATTVTKTEPLVTSSGSVATSGAPSYDMDADDFQRLIRPDEHTVYLISTITGDMLKKNPHLRHPLAQFYVPYTGPDQTRCCREDGQIKWVSELMEIV